MTMRLLALLLITWALLGACHAERADIKVFRVSKTGKNKDLLLRLFEDIRSQEAPKKWIGPNDFTMVLEVRQRVSPTTYLVDWITGINHPDRRFFMQGGPYWYIAKKPLNKVDGEAFPCLGKVTDEVKSYTTVLKAKKTVRVIKEVDESDLNLPPPPPPLTKEKFLEELKSGKTWTVTFVDNCKTCGGSGKLKSSLSRTRVCNSCSDGRFSRGRSRVTYSVRW